MAKDVVKEYTNGEVTVIWDSKKCIHSANCVKNLKSVFNPRQRPWINLEGADKYAVIDAVNKCPSGAISIKTAELKPENKDAIQATTIQMLSNGPMIVSGSFLVKDKDGKPIECNDKVALCRCGASANKPFCDGAHKQSGFEG